MIVTDLKSRGHKILEAVILAYVESATPVGSESLLQQYPFRLSPATIRNVMAELETQGLITHPHTSSGRVPTDRGYRYYVDLLMEPRRLTVEEGSVIDSLSQSRVDDPIAFLDVAARHLSEMTQEAGVVLVPQLAQGSFRRLELILMDPGEVVGVLIASEGMIKHALLELDEPVDENELERIERFVNQELAGMPLSQVFSHLERARLEATDVFFHLYKRTMDLFNLGPFLQEEDALILEGASWILQAPEFRDIQRTRRLMKALEEKEALVEILRKDLAADEVKVHIGSENRGTSLTDCTIVAAPFRLRGGLMGTMGILGPTRMNYPRVTSVVGRMAQAVCRAFQG